MMSNISWYSADLRQRLELCLQYNCEILDRDLNQEPFFGIRRCKDGTAQAFHLTDIGIPHITGRALDTIYSIESSTGIRCPEAVEQVYVDYLFSCCDLPDNLPVFRDPQVCDGRPVVEFHNLRECLEALVWLVKLRGSRRALRVIDGFLDTLLELTNPETKSLDPALLSNLPEEKQRKFHRLGEVSPTMGQGRLVGPLVLLYQETGNTHALQLAQWYAESTMEVCFDSLGTIRDEAFTHVHSITSTLSGVLALGMATSNPVLCAQVRQIYEHGLRSAYSTYGYCKEHLYLPTQQGESNQVGDLIQIQLMLAKMESPALWYSRAEKFMRGGILPAQVLEPRQCILPTPSPQSDAQRDMEKRALGGFGFPNPSCHLTEPDSIINTIDITQGAAQAICAFSRQIVTQDPLGIRVNLLFDCDSPLAQVQSALPRKGIITITPKIDSNLAVRIPENLVPGTFTVQVNGRQCEFYELDGYAYVTKLPAGSRLELTFEPAHFLKKEFINHREYTVEWYGEQAIGVSEQEGIYPLFGDFFDEETE